METKKFLALALLLPVTAWAQDVQYPPRRAGLWEGTVKLGERVVASKYCVDAATDRQLMEMGNQKLRENGGKISVKVEGNVVHISGVSKAGDRTMTMEQTMTFNGDSQITGVGHMSFDPPMPAAAAKAMPGDMAIEQHWSGVCPADMKPGDMITNGQKFNVTEMMKK
jgi:hypothetical protein